MKIYPVIIITLILVAVFVSSAHPVSWPWEWFGGKDKEEEGLFSYEFESGWKVIKMMPAWESKRVRVFDSKIASDYRRFQRIVGYGNFKLYHEMYFMNYENWWVMVVDIPSDRFLYIPMQAKITMRGISREDTVSAESQRICFCKGWNPQEYQHTVFDNSETHIYVKPYRGIGRDDFEHGTVKEMGGGKEYIVGYVYFGKGIPEVEKVVGFSFTGIESHALTKEVTRR